MSKKKRRAETRATKPPHPKMLAALEEAEALIQDKRLDEARERLEALDRRYPGRPEVLTELVNLCHEQKDLQGYLFAIEDLVKVQPDDPDANLGLAGGYLTNLYPMLGLRAFRRFLERWPEHPRAADVRRTMADLGDRMDAELASEGLGGEMGVRVAELHEEARDRLERGDYAAARKKEEELLRLHPEFVPALNNIAQTHFAEGDLDRAIPIAERVLGLDPGNVHALSNLTRFYFLGGRFDDAQAMADRLKAVESSRDDGEMKQAEALALLGDDAGVLEAFRRAERDRRLSLPHDALLLHLAAVASLRLGDEKQARKLWKQALAISPSLNVARENLDDLNRPEGERHAPWLFPLNHWLSGKALGDLSRLLAPATRRGTEGAGTGAMRRFLQQHPEVVALFPHLLDRGDPVGREFAMRTAAAAGTPEMHAVLRDFAVSQRGPESMRMDAARVASRAGLLPQGKVRLWIRGHWQEVALLDFEIYDEPTRGHSPQVERWLEEAIQALYDSDFERAEPLLRKALEVEPDAPDTLNNLASMYSMQGRNGEAEALVHQIHERYPDYFFGRTNLAIFHSRAGRTKEARELLEPLLTVKRLHSTEYAALCHAFIELYLAEGNRDGARSWLKMWEDVDPDHPQLDADRARVNPPSLRSLLRGWKPRSSP